MKKILLLSVCVFPFFCNASEAVNAEYSVTSLYSGTIGKSNITMNLTTASGAISGVYIYNKFKKNIFLKGVSSADLVVLNEIVGNSTAVMTLKPTTDGYTGQWCNKQCLPVNLLKHDSFKDGQLNNVKLSDSESGGYELKIEIEGKVENISLSDAIDTPTVDFIDVNSDGFYDVIVRTDHRPNNGSQSVYISTDKGFVEQKELSGINGTLTYKPFAENIVFDSKDDCCERYSKIIYSFNNGKLVKVNDMSFDYSNQKGHGENGNEVSKEMFESF
ncbi:XAC2610-related protein [Cedecea davisae]|uniref:XAC2610-related protein n=1 Tax=Cedecea davisae TaxID=158484 RepID=UPI00376EA8E5